jgi:hypothetical protein
VHAGAGKIYISHDGRSDLNVRTASESKLDRRGANMIARGDTTSGPQPSCLRRSQRNRLANLRGLRDR